MSLFSQVIHIGGHKIAVFLLCHKNGFTVLNLDAAGIIALHSAQIDKISPVTPEKPSAQKTLQLAHLGIVGDLLALQMQNDLSRIIFRIQNILLRHVSVNPFTLMTSGSASFMLLHSATALSRT